MWICRDCGTENEDNFKFCWSCGQTREKIPTVETSKIIEDAPPKPELKKENVREIKPSEDSKPKIESKSFEKIKPIETTKVERQKTQKNEIELFSTVLPYSKKSFVSNNEVDWEIKVFRIAVRLAGLFFVYQFIIALPDFIILINSAVKNSAEISDAFTNDVLISIARYLFYFFVGIYLIASGRILMWLLPNR